MRHIPRSSRIFIGVLVITLLLSYVALQLSGYVANYTLQTAQEQVKQDLLDRELTLETKTKEPKLNTENWESYEDATYPISFKYPKGWTVKGADNKQGFYDIVLNPGVKFSDLHIYISKDDYYGLAGLKQTPTKIAGLDAFIVAKNLYGIKVGEYHYTIDGSMNSTQDGEFNTLLDTIVIR